jgi:uncharacterized protein
MDLWRGSLRDFIRTAESGSIAGELGGAFARVYDHPPSDGEHRSWSNSLPALAQALRTMGRRDVGVEIRSAHAVADARSALPLPGAIGVAAEYHLPLSNRRLDVLLCGKGVDDHRRAVVVELKQWSEVAVADEFETNVLVGGRERVHPSQQALDYADWLSDYHSAFVAGDVLPGACSYLHNLGAGDAELLRHARFSDTLARSPLFTADEELELSAFVTHQVGAGEGMETLEQVASGRFRPSPRVIASLEAVMEQKARWHLLDEQRQAYNAIMAEVRRLARRAGHSAVLVRGAPGTGKTVIAVQVLADAMRLGLRAAHVTGGKAFTTALRAQFRGADKLFQWNMNLRNAHTQELDVALIDEAHRIRETSDIRYTPRSERGKRTQIEELINAAKVAVFFLDENQFVRPDELGSTALVVETCGKRGIPLRKYDLSTQFRCGGCTDYIAWIDRLLGFGTAEPGPWLKRYRFELAGDPEDLDELIHEARAGGPSARTVAGFCWRWSAPRADGTLVEDVAIGSWRRPWNAKHDPRKRYTPSNDPYTLWAESEAGFNQIGCIYSAQGFEFERVGVIWGPDLVWRTDRWVAQPSESYDRAIKGADSMLQLVRNAYRVLLTRGTTATRVLCIDPETRAHVARALEEAR